MLKALPKNAGTIKGRKVSTQPSLLNRMYWGSTVTWNGTMIVASTTKNRTVEPGARRRAKPYATSAAENVSPIIGSKVTMREFLIELINGVWSAPLVIACPKESQLGWSGQITGGMAMTC